MSREIWKKVFGTISDEDLVHLLDIWSLKVNGFRQVNKDNISTARAMAITEALKPTNLKLIKSFYGDFLNIEHKEKEVKIRGEDVKHLLKLYQDGLDLHMILGTLYSSPEKDDQALAAEFENLLLEEYRVNSLDNLPALEDSDEETNEEQIQEQLGQNPSNEVTQWESKWQKSEAKNKELRKTIESWEKKYSDLKKEHKQEKQQWVKERVQLQQEIGTEKSSGNDYKKELEAATKEVEGYKAEIQKLKSEISHLNALLLKSNSAGASQKSLENIEASKAGDQPLHIALIGDPKNRLTEESKDPIFHVFTQENLNEALEKDVLVDFDGVWIMNYLIPSQIKRKLKKQNLKNIIEFNDFPTMKRYITKGR